ncbi:GlxA family transcriptional regulator [Pseudonocardia halophobica]|uniref:GlxA family transcriptional regulator n=1 Tax=Pseudonocardia halophobica TaxID=29401 RepID=UPI000562E697|nr:helix-turn-helix domain-containing protein [Pseudonocardia halophobica]
MTHRSGRHRVVVPLFDGIQPLDVVGPHEVLRIATYVAGGRGYDVELVGVRPGPVRSETGLDLVARSGLPAGPIDTLLVPGGGGARRQGPPGSRGNETELVSWIRHVAPQTRRLVSVCTGAFLLAAAGLLRGEPATTHWRWAERLSEEHPEVDVQPDPIYVRSGRIWSSAGVTAGMDLALALVEEDLGPDVAQSVARELVLPVRRAGGQSQYASPVWAPPAPRPSVRAAQDIVHAEPAADLRVPVLAARVGMSERHFAREFTRLVGTPPGVYVERVRVEAARGLLESGGLTVTAVASRAGFGSAETMRRAFLRRLGVAPDHYRRRFAGRPGIAGS